ncbi:MAG TPA: 23S rRNA (adenine(2503)-C(2))-methyltransferase RlmN [Acidimicrobiia bacterium]|nr:23S rRNA (adenine(2503)-C(2))-methyltransferase RlmN [Acidimicrobiia bacterium]
MAYLTHPDSLVDLVEAEPSYRVDQLREWLYRHPVLDPAEMTNLPKSLRESLELWPFSVAAEQIGDGGLTRKWLFTAPDGADIEAVLMGYPKRATLCISSQAGCALGCTFCATGQFGFERHLEPGEIVAQVAYARAFLSQIGMPGAPDRLTNIVFMGMGEPLANYDRVREAIRRMIEEMGMSPRSITVSTVGMIPGIRRLAEEGWPLNLAISLHAADDELRSSLVPINRRYPIADLEQAAIEYLEKTGRRVSIEWTMMDGVNDTDDQARRLADIARRIRAHVNLIALNPTPGTDNQASTAERMDRFVQILGDLGVTATIRDTRGQDIDAACGQLRARSHEEGQAVQVRVGRTD